MKLPICRHSDKVECIYCKTVRLFPDFPKAELSRFAHEWFHQNKKSYSGNGCDACGKSDEPYMLKHSLWRRINFGKHKGFLCLACVRKRLGRLLEEKDFQHQAINFGVFGFDCREYVKQERARMYIPYKKKIAA